MKKSKSPFLIFMIFIILSFNGVNEPYAKAQPVSDEESIRQMLQVLFEERTKLLIDKEESHIAKYYDLTHGPGKYAFGHETNRANYVAEWGLQRGIRFTDAAGTLKIVRIKVSGEKASVSLIHSLKLTYHYLDHSTVLNHFGLGTRHALLLTKNKDKWILASEWYSDPLEENPKLIYQGKEKFLTPYVNTSELHRTKGGFDRKRAVDYANKYAGLAWGTGNNHRYNQKYLDYTSKGGDCTNFSSQTLGDPEEGGGLRRRAEWTYIPRSGGTRAWVNTDQFKSFLIRSGYATVLKQGDYGQIVEFVNKSNAQEQPYSKRLQPGDLIAYVMKGDIDHFSIVVGFDTQGYPLVNSHTPDRYRVPFDLGWDKYTKYQLIHIKD